MQFHGGAHCGNTAPRLTAAAEKMEILPLGSLFPPRTTKTAKIRPTPMRGLLGAPGKLPAGHSCRTQHLGSGGQDYAPSERPSTADFALLRRPGVKFFHLQFMCLRDRHRNMRGCPKRLSRQGEFYDWNTTSCVRRIAPGTHCPRTRYPQGCAHARSARPAELGARLTVRCVTGRS